MIVYDVNYVGDMDGKIYLSYIFLYQQWHQYRCEVSNNNN